MIQRISHATVFVLDQDRAKAFYTEKLGFEVRTDQTIPIGDPAKAYGEKMDGFRWLTVGPKGQPELELILMGVRASESMDETTVDALKRLLAKGALGAGVMATADCNKTYEELKAKGVEFIAPPTERPYGIEALFKDDSGNWFSLTQRR